MNCSASASASASLTASLLGAGGSAGATTRSSAREVHTAIVPATASAAAAATTSHVVRFARGSCVEGFVEPLVLGLGVGAVHRVLRVSVEEGRQLTLDVPRAHDGSSHCWASAAIPRLACFLTDPRETPSVSAISASLWSR